MSDYVKLADYAAKDALASGDLQKVVRGTELGADFDAIAVAIATKYDSADLNVTLQQYNANTIVFASGTAMLFYQNTAPTGWTKSTTSALDNCALRIVSDNSASGGNGGVTGGSATFNAILGASNSTASANADLAAHTHTATSVVTDPGHLHAEGVDGGGALLQGAGGGYAWWYSGNTASATTGVTVATTVNSSGSGGGHSHNLNFDIKYASFIVATKN